MVKSSLTAFLRLIAALSTFAGYCSAAMIVVAVAITCQMIVVRFVLNGSTIWQSEAVIYLVIAATLIGLPYVQRLKGHVAVDLLPLALPLKARFILIIVTFSLSIAIIAVMTWHSYDYWHLAFQRGWKSDSVWGVSLWIPYLSMPIGFGLLLLQLSADLIATLIKIDHTPSLEET